MKKTILLILMTVAMVSCKKYLDERPSKSLVVPSTLADLQALLDYHSRVNTVDPGAFEASADNIFLSDADFASLLSEDEKRVYTWEKDRLFTRVSNDYGFTYDNVYRANTVLQQLSDIPRNPSNAVQWDNVYGQAMFIRARSFHNATMLWSLTYDAGTAGADLGIPLRLDPDFNQVSTRSSVAETYARIESDVLEAVRTLPVNSVHVMRASKTAAYALTARIYLSMRSYDKAYLYADSAWQLNKSLIDYNTLSATAAFPFKQFNSEVLYETQLTNWGLPFTARIDSNLYNSYHANDLRRTLYFTNLTGGTHGFKGSYSGGAPMFHGISTGEVLLMRAECAARAGNTTAAMQDLNLLLAKRYKSGTFVPLTALSPEAALASVLTERRKELVMRALRWMDIKRLNKEGANITLARKLNGTVYTLPPNDLRYALPIPESVIEKTGMPQNPR